MDERADTPHRQIDFKSGQSVLPNGVRVLHTKRHFGERRPLNGAIALELVELPGVWPLIGMRAHAWSR